MGENQASFPPERLKRDLAAGLSSENSALVMTGGVLANSAAAVLVLAQTRDCSAGRVTILPDALRRVIGEVFVRRAIAEGRRFFLSMPSNGSAD